MKKQLLFLGVFFLSVCASAAVYQKETGVRQHGKEAGMLLDLGKISLGTLNDVEEKKQYLSTVQLEKQRIQNYMLRMVYENAYQFYKQGDYQRAQEMAQTILSIDPNFKQAQILSRQAGYMGTYGTTSEAQVVESKFQEAGYLYESGRLVEANDRLNEILTIQPGNARALSWKNKIDGEIAKEYARRGDEAEKNGEYQKAIDAWYNSLLMRKDDPALVAKINDAENKLRQQQVHEYMQQAMEFYNQGKYVESYAVFERIVKIQPGDPRVQKYMSQLKNEIAAGYYTAGEKSYNNYRFDQAISYWNNAKKWGGDANTLDGLIRQARTSKEKYYTWKREATEEARREAEEAEEAARLAAEMKAKQEKEAKEAAQKKQEAEELDTIPDIDTTLPGMGLEPTMIPGAEHTSTSTTTKVTSTTTTTSSTTTSNETLPNMGVGISQVSQEASAASRAKYIEGLDAFNQDDYERARQAWIVAKQLDPGNTDADLGLRKVEEMLK